VAGKSSTATQEKFSESLGWAVLLRVHILASKIIEAIAIQIQYFESQ
jgi:hypothetical protein